MGKSRSHDIKQNDHTALLGWSHHFSPRWVHDFRAQFNYRRFQVTTTDPFGPEININGFGLFNREFTLPNNSYSRRTQVAELLTFNFGAHAIKMGAQALFRSIDSRAETFFAGRFTFGPLPGRLVSPALQSVSLNSLQAFNLGLPQVYQQGFGNPQVTANYPYYGFFFRIAGDWGET